MEIFTAYFDSPIGFLEAKSTESALLSLNFTEEKLQSNEEFSPVLEQLFHELTEYFAGIRRTFSVPLRAEGTAFQERIWAELLRIPFGATVSYRELARRIGDEKSIRAVGTANGRNPISILIPCHRVIGSSGNLVGYAGGIERKKFLISHEAAIAGASVLF